MCELALPKCTGHQDCGLALHDFRIGCRSELFGRQSDDNNNNNNNGCTDECRISVLRLTKSALGVNYLYCRCGESSYCNLIQKRLKRCYPQSSSSSQSDMTDCHTIELYCRADANCAQLWSTYRDACGPVVVVNSNNGNDGLCDGKCVDSFDVLSNEIAMQFGTDLLKCRCNSSNNNNYWF
ncbi:growth arrest-specific protein 1-like [Oppia nitens]|uniref:growth arrest-specific protein 1-like n=1 Tax=Oppia nitens TaxID=1686743 RepID=UPI0023DC9633|nr:growth arrest-specific protein 1-like [Oppia nitens]